MRRRIGRRRIGLGLAAALLLGACGGSGDGDSAAANVGALAVPQDSLPSVPGAAAPAGPPTAVMPVDTAAQGAAVRAVVARLYAGHNTPAGADYQLSAAFDRAWKRAVGRDGAMDGDPFCQCQDFDHVRVTGQQVTLTGDTARDEVTFVNFGTTTRTVLGLVREGGRWRIDDIIEANGRGMKAAMLAAPPGSYDIGG